jgi:hypothetical protein
MKTILNIFLLVLLCSNFFNAALLYSQETKPAQISFNQNTYSLYPQTHATLPEIPSPLTTKNGLEVLCVGMKNGQYALVPVTVENGAPLHYSKRIKSVMGKDQQLQVDSGDFPTLAATGLHANSELDNMEMITGFPVSLITYIGRPDRFSGAGFMADDEEIISILKGDNQIVKKLALTHPQMSKPLFQVWNIILKEVELGNWGRFWDNIPYFFYNGRKIMLKANGTKGWQISIFQDEIQGSFDIEVNSVLSPEEKAFLKERYPRLSAEQMAELEKRLTTMHFSEMAPYYIMRYAFYEGHTGYRSDPIAIAFIFGLKNLEQIENIFQGNLYKNLTDHFTTETIRE